MMTRREMMAVAGGAAFGGRLEARADGPSVRYRDYSRCLPDYLRELAGRAYRLRNGAIARLTTAAASASVRKMAFMAMGAMRP